ncbi:MAG: outer membrane beta-barrel protein [Firmicutes bacterium]|nr:outer membrane beta-barrel protein [Bacillota bacterium]
MKRSVHDVHTQAGRLATAMAMAVVVFLLVPDSVKAQDFARWEVNGGFAYQSLRAPGMPFRDDAVGGWGGMAFHLTPHVSLTADLGFQKNPECAQDDFECIIQQLAQPFLVTYSSLQFLGGPRVSTRRAAALDFFGQFQVGLVRTRATVINLDTLEVTTTKSGARFAMGLGGGMDWNVLPELAIRIVQVDYLPVWHSDAVRHSVRVRAGVVVRFGGQP